MLRKMICLLAAYGWLLILLPQGLCQTPKEVERLIQDLSSKDSFTRLIAAKQLGMMKGQARDAIGPLQQVALNDADAGVRTIATRALAAIKEDLKNNPPPAVQQPMPPPQQPAPPEQPQPQNIEPKPEGQAPELSPELRTIVSKLQANDSASQQEALRRLSQMGREAKPAARALVQYLSSNPDPQLSLLGYQILEKLEPEVYPHVVTMHKDNDIKKKGAAIVELMKLGNNARCAIPAIVALIDMYHNITNNTSRRDFSIRDPSTSYLEVVFIPSLYALVSIGPDDPETHKTIFSLDKLIVSDQSVRYLLFFTIPDHTNLIGITIASDSNNSSLVHFVKNLMRTSPGKLIIVDLFDKVKTDDKTRFVGLASILSNLLSNRIEVNVINYMSGFSDISIPMVRKMHSLKVDNKDKMTTYRQLLSLNSVQQNPKDYAPFQVEVINKLMDLGSDAKPALPLLKQLKLSSEQSIREAATEAVARIEQAP